MKNNKLKSIKPKKKNQYLKDIHPEAEKKERSQYWKKRMLHYSTNPYLIAKKGGKVKNSNYNGWDIQPT